MSPWGFAPHPWDAGVFRPCEADQTAFEKASGLAKLLNISPMGVPPRARPGGIILLWSILYEPSSQSFSIKIPTLRASLCILISTACAVTGSCLSKSLECSAKHLHYITSKAESTTDSRNKKILCGICINIGFRS